MKLKVLTVAGEYGSGGARIAGTVARKLLDSEIIDRIERTHIRGTRSGCATTMSTWTPG